MVQSLALAWLTLSHRITIAEVLALSAMQGIINAFDMPGRQSFMVKMVEDRADLSNAIAINSSMVNTARLIGPSLAGLLIAATNEGWCFLVDGVSYIAVIASLLMMRIPPRSGAARNDLDDRATARGLDLRRRLRAHPHHPAAVCAAQPDGLAVHGAHADLRRRRFCTAARTRWAF